MSTIQSLTGELSIEDLGHTLIHEHLRTRDERVVAQFPHLYDVEEEVALAVEQVKAAKERGVQTIFDPTVMGLDRDVRFMKRIADETGMQIIAATGIYTFHYLPTRFVANDIDFMAKQFVRDIEVGVQNTSIRAGFLKCATDIQGVTPDVEKVIRAVAWAHHQTGVPIMTHSHPASETGLKQIAIFKEEGVPLNNVLIGHCGDTDNLDYIERVIDSGAFIGMDRYGITRVLSTEKRNQTVIELVIRGYANRMFLSQDYCCTTDFHKPEAAKRAHYPDWSMTFLMDKVIPTLKENGVSAKHIQMMMVENVKSWISIN
ncbi:phosphotriesterase [Peribacillus frigoritolerans]|uniref:phosphotriesterase family protein n=1 Tax=Peribacillus frigoritolerans TaxID=450367 RepID=UPI002E1A6B97|nr:phosphotriesterase [Peribacillus frigoritolerans]MED3849166.1 phosphotriesterase [Peribacillus frigoritolerans]